METNQSAVERFKRLQTRKDVASLLDISDKSLRYFLFKRRTENLYDIFNIPKRNGGVRTICSPCKQLKQIQRKLSAILNEVYEPKICSYGFIHDRNIVNNAEKHTKRNLVLNIDLKNFFTQIHFGRIKGMLMKPPYSIGEEAAITIAQIVCYNKSLPQGAPSSPVLTNMICAPLDNQLMRLAKKVGCTYTRYADDITFSTQRKYFDESIVYEKDDNIILGSKLLSILKANSFEVNSEKTTLRSKFVRQEVTGLTVNSFPNLRRSYVRNLRSILHHCEKQGTYFTAQEFVSKGFCKNKKICEIISNPQKKDIVIDWFKKVIIGKVNYIKQIRGSKNLIYLSFAQMTNRVFDEGLFDVSHLNYLDALIRNTYVVHYKWDGKERQGSAFYIKELGLFTSYHVTHHKDLEKGVYFKIYNYSDQSEKNLGFIGCSLNEISSDADIDYALYNTDKCSLSDSHPFKLGDSTKLKLESQVTIIGYPNYKKGNSPYVQTCNITSTKSYLGGPFYTVSGRIAHGSSGGVVLNENYEVVGIIKGGIASLDDSDDDTNENQGFVPIHVVLYHMEHSNVVDIEEEETNDKVST